MEKYYGRVDVRELDNHYYFVNYDLVPNTESELPQTNKLLFHHLSEIYKHKISSHDSGISIASAIASYARIDLCQKLIAFSACYFDTDSLVPAQPILSTEKAVLSDKMGDLKNVLAPYFPNYMVENDTQAYFEEGIFLAPKSYIIKLTDGSKNKYIVKGVSLYNVDFEDLLMYNKFYQKNESSPVTFERA